jgi:hypothetical protein
MEKYYTCGLRLLSEIHLPELSPDKSGDPHDVFIRLLPDLAEPLAAEQTFFSEQTQVFRYEGVGVFEIHGLDEIVVRPEPGVPMDILSFPLLGPVLALLLHMRGRYVLHASAVNFDFGAAVFMGDKGAGKSTLAASLLRHPEAKLISDDLVVLDEANQILPGFAQMKIEKDLAAGLSHLGALERPVEASWFPKTRLRLPYETETRSFPVSAVYQLHRDRHARVEPMTQLDAVRAAYRFSYFIRFGTRKRSIAEDQSLFRTVSNIARNLRFFRLFVPNQIQLLPETYSLLRAQAETKN